MVREGAVYIQPSQVKSDAIRERWGAEDGAKAHVVSRLAGRERLAGLVGAWLSASLDPTAARCLRNIVGLDIPVSQLFYHPGSGVAALPAAVQPFPLALIDICIRLALPLRLPRINPQPYATCAAEQLPRRSPRRVSPIS